MLGLAGTIELRENMAISLIDISKRHCRLLGIVAGLSILMPGQGLALEVSSPVGIQEIGKRLHLKSVLSGIPEGAESQLRSTCLKARIKSIETSGKDNLSAVSTDVLVDFQPTIRQGGMIEFQSLAPVSDALVEIELTSECPLVVFTSRWTLIMNVNSSQGGAVSATHNSHAAKDSIGFDFDNSSLLVASRRAPKPVPQYSIPKSEDTTPKKSESPTNVQREAETLVDEMITPPAVQEVEREPVRIASLHPDILTSGLIESRPSPHMMDGGLGLDAIVQSRYEESTGFDAFLSLAQSLWFVLSALLMLLVSIYLVQKRLRPSGLRAAVVKSDLVVDTQKTTISEFREASSHGEELPQDASTYTKDRVLESLIASDDSGYEDLLDSGSTLNQSDLLESLSRSSLKVSMELINRADIRTWDLPTAYHSLIEQRNKSLQLHRTPDALLLRCHIGLIELAFQDAKQGDTTQTQTTLDLLGLVLGEHVYDVDSISTLCVPDIVKSHVRAKMCEITGAENRQLLRENLINLNMQVLSPALCFHTDAWREFLSDEGALN